MFQVVIEGCRFVIIRCLCSSDMHSCLKTGTGWTAAAPKTQEKNVKNLLCQLNSLKEVGQLWQTQFDTGSEEYAAVAFMRPDVLYRDPFPVHVIERLKVRYLFLLLLLLLMGMCF